MLGCDALLSASAVGSLKEEYPPRHAVIPDQFIDRTRHRADTFFDGGVVAHAGFADPVCPVLSDALEASAREAGLCGPPGRRRTSAWRARSSRRAPSRTSTAPGAPT